MMICATGTTIFQAALIKKPCIMLGKTGTLKKLPNVFINKNFNKLTKQIIEIMITSDFKKKWLIVGFHIYNVKYVKNLNF